MDILDEMKQALRSQLDEWLSFDIPEENDDDYQVWQSRLSEIEAIESVSDVYHYLGDDERALEFLSEFGIEDYEQ
ncbi:MAG: hypothetical protein AB2689_27520 [Candidatus Thiodiazotropha taylori]